MKSCFVISPIGEDGSETRKRADTIMEYIIVPAVKECGYEATRADQIAEPGMITSQVIQRIIDDEVVVADLTGRNPNVFYELAIRHAIRKPFIQIIREGEQIPFDVSNTRTIYVNEGSLESADKAKNSIILHIKAIERSDWVSDSPISTAIDLQSLKQSDDPERRSLAEVLSALSEVRSEILNMDKSIKNLHENIMLERKYDKYYSKRIYSNQDSLMESERAAASAQLMQTELAIRSSELELEKVGRKPSEKEAIKSDELFQRRAMLQQRIAILAS
jgi:hypothetical protein